MVTEFKDLISSLKQGDLLLVPLGRPLIEEDTLFSVTVLRVDDQGGGIYLSRLFAGPPISVPNTDSNPFRWEFEKNALVDCNGEVASWYSEAIRLDPGGAMEAATEYAAVPRADQVNCTVTREELEDFEVNPLALVIEGIARNGEAGSQINQLSLVLDAVGLTGHTPEQLAAIASFMSQIFATQLLQQSVGLITIRLSGDIADSAEESPPSK